MIWTIKLIFLLTALTILVCCECFALGHMVGSFASLGRAFYAMLVFLLCAIIVTGLALITHFNQLRYNRLVAVADKLLEKEDLSAAFEAYAQALQVNDRWMNNVSLRLYIFSRFSEIYKRSGEFSSVNDIEQRIELIRNHHIKSRPSRLQPWRAIFFGNKCPFSGPGGTSSIRK